MSSVPNVASYFYNSLDLRNSTYVTKKSKRLNDLNHYNKLNTATLHILPNTEMNLNESKG